MGLHILQRHGEDCVPKVIYIKKWRERGWKHGEIDKQEKRIGYGHG